MERNYMRSESLMEMDFTTERHIAFHSHENFELLFVISGKLVITIDEDTYQLNTGDMIAVNINRKHSYNGSQDLVMGRFLISYIKVRELLGQAHVLFWCNSTVDCNEAYDELRRLIVKIFNQSLGKDNRNQLYISSMYYQMLHILTENFLLTEDNLQFEEEKNREDFRIQEIFAYIRANYRQSITLDDIASHLYLSPIYVSKYIKQKCNINFMELLNTVRLGRAMEDLMYSEDSIMKIALENGFASVAAYNKAFKKAYEKTPSEFRRQRKFHRQEAGEQEKKQRILVEKKVEEYLERNPNEKEPKTELLELTAAADVERSVAEEWDGYCCKMINAGRTVDLMNSIFQDQILACKQLLGFEYVRFWDIYAQELYIDIHALKGHQNYSRLNAVTDFLVKNRLKPYIELGFKPMRILKTTRKAVKEIERDQQFLSESEMREFYRDLMRNFVNRYGAEEVGGWYFEYWEKTNVNYRTLESYHYTAMAEEGHRDYFRRFSVIAGVLRECLPSVRIGGGGFPVRLYGENGFAQILTVWKQEKERPDFISLNCYPYMQEKEADSYYEKRNTDLEFVRHNIEMTVNAMHKANFPETELHVSEYSLSLSNRNVINDSCMKGAFLVYNAISCLGKADIMGHWLFTDAYADEQDTGALLFGGCGLLSKDGITKPAYYAMEFLNRLYRRIIKIHSNYIITSNDNSSIRMVCHNMKKLNYNYYIAEENSLQIKDVQVIMENREFMTIHVKFVHVKDGTYSIKRNRLNRSCGSVQDKWEDLNMESDLTMREMEYLKMVSVSAISIQQADSKDHCLEFDVELEPNEIQYIHILMK